MTDKKADKVIDEAVKEVATKVKKVVEADKPLVAEPTIRPASPQIRQEFGSRRTNSRLKKSVESAKQLGATVTEVDAVKGPSVVIAGMRISPIATGLKPTGGSGDVYVYEGKEFYLPNHLMYNPHTRNGFDADEPWVARTTYKAPEMSLFVFVYDNETFHILMDDHSSFTRDAEGYYPRTKSGQLIMINSTSRNDQFVNQAVLANVESENNILNQSHLIVNSNRVGPERGWGGSGPFKLGSKRQKYSDLRLKKVDAIDSQLTRGRYFSCNFTSSAIDGSSTQESDLSHTYLTETRIKGGRITLTGLNGEKVDISAVGDVLVKGVGRMEGQQWSFPSVHVTNRFAFTEIDYTARNDRGIKMVRVDEKNVELAVNFWGEHLKLAIDTPRHTVEVVVRDSLREDKDKKAEPLPFQGPFGGGYMGPFQSQLGSRGFAGEKPGETIRNFMETYIVDQVVSRLAMIQLLDEVEATAKDLAGRRGGEYLDYLE